jgi:hypothetical protein
MKLKKNQLKKQPKKHMSQLKLTSDSGHEIIMTSYNAN